MSRLTQFSVKRVLDTDFGRRNLFRQIGSAANSAPGTMLRDGHMKPRCFRHRYHDSHLARFTLGPRRELTLEIALDPVWNKDKRSASVRFGGIENYDEVASFFRALSQPARPDAYIAEIIRLQYGGGGSHCVVELADYGHVRVHSHHVTEL